MSGTTAIIIWLGIVIASGLIVVYLARRWGHDPFGWALLSAFLGPMALVGLVGTYQADRSRRSHERRRPPSGAGPIVLASDGSAAADALVAHVIGQDQEVVVLHVLPYEMRPGEAGAGLAMSTAEEATARTMRLLRDAGLRPTLEVRYGVPGEAIEEFANEVNASLIVVGRRGSGLARTLLGSTSRHVVEHAARPVFVAG